MTLKARYHDPRYYTSRNLVWGTSAYGDGRVFSSSSGGQYVSSEGHPYRNLGKGGDVGGPFTSQKVEIANSHPEPVWIKDGSRYNMYTRIFPSADARNAEVKFQGSSDPSIIASAVGSQCLPLVSDSYLDTSGATAINRCRPASSVVESAAVIAELIGERKLFAIPGRDGKLSGEYLNYQLGISPSLGAIRDFQEAAKNSEKLLSQLHRDSGRRVRRRYTFPPKPTTLWEGAPEVGVYPVSDVALNSYVVGTGTRSTRSYVTERTWFSGAFVYHVPKEVGVSRSIAELDYLYGVKPGIDTAWEVIPFSFVADYFSNMGDVLSNLNALALDGLVLAYGYIMHENLHEWHQVWTGPIKIDGVWQTVELACSLFCANKQRKAANPFGFGLTDDDLSLRQLSILAALGINRR